MRALALIVLVACSDLESIQTGVCGNGAIDDTEDCDSSDVSQCVACQLVCQDSATPCPTGYACGADGFCRAPSGVFYPTPPTTFTTNEYAVSDVNWDGAGDVLGLTQTSINVLQGDATPEAQFSTRYSMLTPFGRGQPTFGDFDDDGHPDILLPSADGLAGFSSQYQALGPHAFAFNPGGGDAAMDGFTPALVFSFHPGYVAFLFGTGTVLGQPGIRLGLLDVNSGDTGPNLSYIPIVCDSVIASPAITYDAYIVATAPLQAMVAVRDPANHVCAFRVTIPGAGTDPFAVTKLAEATIANSTRPVFADFDGTGCPSVVVAPNKEVRAAATSPCTLTAAVTNLPGLVVGTPAGRVPLQLTGPTLVGPDALITSFGVFAVAKTRATASVQYVSDRAIDVAAFGDIDGDGKLDAVLGSEASNGVDVLYRTDTAFLLYRIGTTGNVTNLATGDYDGNGVSDIVFTERLVGERLMVAYGTQDRPLEPVENGRFGNVISFLPVQISDSIDRTGIVLDLAVVDMPVPNELLLTVLHGSPQRTLVSYFDPRNGGGGNFDPAAGFFAAIAGQFAPDTAATDVIAIEWEAPQARLYINIGIGKGALNQTVKPSSTPMAEPTPLWFNLSDVGQGSACTSTTFCLDGARYLALRRDPVDRLIAIDRWPTPHAISIDAATLKPTSAVDPPQANTPPSLAGLEPGPGLGLVSLRAADVDGDGVEDAIATFVSRTDNASDTADVRVCTQDNFATCSSLTALANETTLVCGDVAPARAQARGQFDDPVLGSPMEPMPLVGICEDSTGRFIYRFVHAGGAFTATKLFPVAGSATRLEVGDVNGDGLDDLLVLDTRGGAMIPQLQAFLQCQSSDVECRKRGAK